MKVYLGPYKNWFGPYQIAEKILFWMDKDKDERVHKFGQWLGENKDCTDSWLTKFCHWIDSKRKRKVKVKIHGYDTWSMDTTLALLILPMLKQLKDSKHGAPFVDDQDVPEHIRSTVAPQKTDGDVDIFHFARWDWIMDEMIWTFEQLQPDNDWEDQYHSGKYDFQFKQIENSENFEMVRGSNDTHKFDAEGYKKHDDRIKNGLKLFGKYYRGLWD